MARGLIQSYLSRVLVWKMFRKSEGWLSFTPARVSKVDGRMSNAKRDALVEQCN